MNLITRIRRLFQRQPMAAPIPNPAQTDAERIEALVERAAWSNGLTVKQHRLLLASVRNLHAVGVPWKRLVVTTFGAAARLANTRAVRNQHSNANVVKMPRHSAQRIKGHQPEPPEAA